MNIQRYQPAAITSQLCQQQIIEGWDCFYDPLTGDVEFHEKQMGWEYLGHFQGMEGIRALHENLLEIQQEHWPR